MSAVPRSRTTWLVVALYAVAMAWVEAASVYYIRTVVDRIEPYQANPLPIHGTLGEVELVREAATLVMLLAIGLLAGTRWSTKLGYSAIAFGIWDIFYYVFLRIMTDWPRSVVDWDILFLLPLPWWGPVIAPVSIAVLMIVWGTLTTQAAPAAVEEMMTRRWWNASLCGILLALGVFMADSLTAIAQGVDVRVVLPDRFPWVVFALALVLMGAPVVRMAWLLFAQPRRAALHHRAS